MEHYLANILHVHRSALDWIKSFKSMEWSAEVESIKIFLPTLTDENLLRILTQQHIIPKIWHKWKNRTGANERRKDYQYSSTVHFGIFWIYIFLSNWIWTILRKWGKESTDWWHEFFLFRLMVWLIELILSNRLDWLRCGWLSQSYWALFWNGTW